MSNYFLASGSWKLRHNEPLLPEEHWLLIYPLLSPIDENALTLVINMQNLETRTAYSLSPNDERAALEDFPPGQTLITMPLAILAREADHWRITHGMVQLTNLDLNNVLFMRAPAEYTSPTGLPLWQHIYDFYLAFHLSFSNHECFYIKDRATTELEQKFHFARPHSYWHLSQKVFAAIDDGDFPGFRILLADEFEKWSYDNYLYQILPDERQEAGYISMLHYCKSKKSWDDPLFMYKKKIYHEDTLERWEKNYFNQWVDRDKQVLLEEFFGYKIAPLPPWRRSRVDVDVESISHGNIFIIAFDHCLLLEHPLAEPLRQCEVEYVETRGFPNRDDIYHDFWKLVEYLQAFFTQLKLEPTQTYFSKLTWLREHENTHLS